MRKPNLQIALDSQSLEEALETVREVGDVVDILEVGTVLCLQEGMKPVKAIRALYPEKTILADTKCADAGKTVAKNCKDAGADWMTVICCATIPTMKAANEAIDQLQVELYGDWTFDQAKEWKNIGIEQVVYHQSRDALLSGQTWGEKDLNKIKKLIDMGFKVSVTGGLNLATLELFKGIDVYTFIAGRSIAKADKPREAAKEFKEKIDQIF
ncbi:MAG: 3-keto-L-gulonate-6-phosphate decarboxylase UlaD [Peptoniphilaceae bacterium]|nr:3-keto-L-gulonate-6-phosphate decarboxylase UlaD [Peptoniphilaceae bacterium]MDY6019219.1 3-keto-L-gulonate-6-phosphate decarboxylase UlaD [Anaerococcus sp.]